MKHGQKPTREQKALLRSAGLIPENWLVIKNQEDHIEVVSRNSLADPSKKARIRKIKKG